MSMDAFPVRLSSPFSTPGPRGRLRLPSLPRDDAATTIVNTLVFIGMLLLLGVSAMALDALGLHYERPGGSLLGKIHPATYVILLALLVRLAASPAPWRHLNAIIARQNGTFWFCLTGGLLLAQIVLVQHLPFSPVIDTFLLPVVLSILLLDADPDHLRRLAPLLHVMFAANALLALFENITGHRLTPYVAGSYVVTNDWRATALFGHPLVNGMLTGTYIIIMSFGGLGAMKPMLRPFAMALQMAALVAFGARAATTLLLPFLLIAAWGGGRSLLRGRRFPASVWLATLLLALLAAAAIGLVGYLGYFDRFAERFVNDNGSASARLSLFHIMAAVPWSQLWLGPDQRIVTALEVLDGSRYGLESLWISFFLTYGILVSLVFFAGLAAFCLDIIHHASKASWMVFIYFFLVATTSVSLSAKTTEFALVVAMVLVFQRPRYQASTSLA
ncbi:MAG: VpsF family polysaccharide biosynthesis protein [Hyphomicrobiales bacterium]|nr:VpsF family polysaccharide biosynthesis protein [Hyphomicrobiales bacterium]